MAATGFRKMETLSFRGPGPARRFFLAALGGALQTLSWPWPGLWPLCFVALVPLLLAVDRRTGRQAFGLGWVYGLALSLTSLPWLADVLAGYGGLGPPLAWLIFFLLCGYLALYPALFAWLVTLRLPGPIFWVLAGAGAWAGLDWLKNWIFTGFNWTPLAGPLALSAEMGQAADIFGFYGLGFFAALVNLLLAVAIFKAQDRESVRPWLLAVLALLLTAFGYGRYRHEQWEAAARQSVSRRIVVIQPAVEQTQKWDEAYRAGLLARYDGLARLAAGDSPWLTLWPETALPFIFGYNQEETEWLTALAGELGGLSLVGVAGQDGAWPEGRLHNRMLLFQDGRMGSWYDKLHLVPFGEYLPLDWLPFFNWSFMQGLIGEVGIFSPGRLRPPVEVPLDPGRDGSRRVRLGIMICFESTFPYLARARVLEGADLLVVPTNDGWFGRSRAPEQHLLHAVMRAIETRRPLARAGNTGISAVIRPSGFIGQETELMAVGAFAQETPILDLSQTRPTPFVRGGFFMGPGLAVLTGILALFRLKARRPNR